MDIERVAPRRRRRNCIVCKELLHPDPRNIGRQKACSLAACQKARKALSQRRWLSKPENRDYFRGPEHVRRVQAWRRKNPNHRPSRAPAKGAPVLQDPSVSQPVEDEPLKLSLTNLALRDALSTQHVLLTGLIALLSGSTLQDDIDSFIRRLIDQGRDIHGMRQSSWAPDPSTPSISNDRKTAPSPRAPPPRSRAL